MNNRIYLESFTKPAVYYKFNELDISLESLVSYIIFKFCKPCELDVVFIFKEAFTENSAPVFKLNEVDLKVLDTEDIPWQVLSCNFPVLKSEDTIVAGLCSVARYICKHRSTKKLCEENDEGLLSFRKGCLQAPNEVSVWTKFCEVDIIQTVLDVVTTEQMNEVPINLIRFENHLNKPVRVHNVYRLVRELKKENKNVIDKKKEITNSLNEPSNKDRSSKPRKWKSNCRKAHEIDCTTKIEDLNISHKFAEGPFFTLADLILLTCYRIMFQRLGSNCFESLLPLTYKWYVNIASIPDVKDILDIIPQFSSKSMNLDNISIPVVDDVSLYKSDPKRHNPKKRLFTKELDIENALSALKIGMELSVTNIQYKSTISWNNVPDGANPFAGHLPDVRIVRKSQQLENLAQAVLEIAQDGDLIVDFCSGSGHLGIFLAHLLPNCTIILLENKEQSLLRARKRVHEMCLKNVYFFQCNLDFFVGKFNIGVALHACGVASDLVLDKCLKANAKFVLCPCCYGSVNATNNRIVYPRSSTFNSLNLDQYLCIGHAADQTHKDHHLTERGARCMGIIDSDRARLAEEHGYSVTMSRLTPLSCTPKNNLLIGIPS
ncbi:PREDICTED: glutathione S-transferase C-terminal domain-containing protein homolog [Papilio xuthus]|uniref:Glutathione S-transferase C-terminal domain-containing protein homolog n=1 Tax=Papilio xuthus TaxID=66420 RepID=A0AAJ6ZVH9_PAPXU|nr:PREDICTED: glutathione S-transferase C-terminal domain-containing protein homolog [Papilio xuthus]